MTRAGIEKHLKAKIPVTVLDITDSTNKQARGLLQRRAVVVANGQTEGRGRLGRSFYSPKDTGIYMSYVFETDCELCDTVRITTAAAVAVARALERDVKIKWVNDIYLGGKKVCGILTESVCRDGRPTHIIIGIGINITTEHFPDGIDAASVGDIDKDMLVAKICDNLGALADNIASADYLDYYRAHLLWLGEPIEYTENGTSHLAVIEGVDDLGGLIVRQNGKTKTLRSGEITLRSSKG